MFWYSTSTASHSEHLENLLLYLWGSELNSWNKEREIGWLYNRIIVCGDVLIPSTSLPATHSKWSTSVYIDWSGQRNTAHYWGRTQWSCSPCSRWSGQQRVQWVGTQTSSADTQPAADQSRNTAGPSRSQGSWMSQSCSQPCLYSDPSIQSE